MTIIAARIIGGVVAIAGDRLMAWGDTVIECSPKVIQKGHALVGMSGSQPYWRAVRDYPPMGATEGGLDYAQAEAWVEGLADHLQVFAANAGHGQMQGSERTIDMCVVVATVHGIWEVGPDFSCMSLPGGISATGSGGSYALGAMYAVGDGKEPADIVRQAAEVACRLSATCGGTIDVLTLGG